MSVCVKPCVSVFQNCRISGVATYFSFRGAAQHILFCSFVLHCNLPIWGLEVYAQHLLTSGSQPKFVMTVIMTTTMMMMLHVDGADDDDDDVMMMMVMMMLLVVWRCWW